MRKLTDPKVGMIVYLRFSDFGNRICRITDIYRHYLDNSIFVRLVDTAYIYIGWRSLTDLFVEDNKHNWLHEGF